jgi:hypothetical protein
MGTALELILKWLPTAINLVTTWKKWIDDGVAVITAPGVELTPEQEKARDAIIEAREASPAWQQDPPQA